MYICTTIRVPREGVLRGGPSPPLHLVRSFCAMAKSVGLMEQERLRQQFSYEKIMSEAVDRKEQRRSSIDTDDIRLRYGEHEQRSESYVRKSIDVLPVGAQHHFDDGGIGQKPVERQQVHSRSRWACRTFRMDQWLISMFN